MTDPIVSISPSTRHELAALAKQLKAIDPAARKALPKRLREAAKPVADEAKRLKPSKLIRIGTRVKLSGNHGASVKVVGTSPKNPPLAGLMELGSKGNSGTIRHPIFGNTDSWASQPTHPYLQPAGLRKRNQAREQIAKVIDDLAKTINAH